MFIHSTSTFLIKPADDILCLKKELEHYTGEKFRRANKFILLSLLGGYKCLHNLKIDKNAAVYLTTENGNLSNTESVLEQIYYKHELPMPYNFINTMSNTASFHVAQKLNISGRNITISSVSLSFERGLELLKTDFALKNITEAVIGGVDESVLCNSSLIPIVECKNRILRQWYENINRAEGSAWLYVTSEKKDAIGEILDIKSFIDKKDGIEWLKAKNLSDKESVIVSFGLLIEPPEREIWKKNNLYEAEFDYIREYGYFDSITSCGISLFLEKYKNKYLVHINKDIQGRYVVLIIKSY